MQNTDSNTTTSNGIPNIPPTETLVGDDPSHPVSGRRAAINRANAQNSTGPKTEEGKKRSSLNALRHGLTSQVVVLPSEDLAAYEKHAQRLADDLKPKGALEEELVQTLIDITWRRHRVAAIENNILTLGVTDHENDLNVSHPEAHAALAMAMAARDNFRAIASLGMHSQRLSREFERTLKQLREVQAERRETEPNQLRHAAALLKMDAKKGISYDPAPDGLVFSNDEIKTFITRNRRLDKALNAY